MTDGLERARAAGIPIIDVDYTRQREAGWAHAELDALRDTAPFVYNEANTGYWMVNRYEHVRSALMMADVFTNTKTSVLGNREHKPRLLPQNLNGADHMAYRRILNPWFGPVAIDRTEPLARRRCQELLDELVPAATPTSWSSSRCCIRPRSFLLISACRWKTAWCCSRWSRPCSEVSSAATRPSWRRPSIS